MRILPGWVAGNRASAPMCSRCRRPRIRPPPRALSVTRHAFGLTWTQTLRAAWWVLRANQVWAPYPDNDPDAARRYMAFYAPVGRVNGERIDPRAAAVLEVRWWHVHRTLQREEPGEGEPLVDALARLYGHVYDVDGPAVRIAASERADAMRLSDPWISAGCDPTAHWSRSSAPRWCGRTRRCWRPCTAGRDGATAPARDGLIYPRQACRTTWTLRPMRDRPAGS